MNRSPITRKQSPPRIENERTNTENVWGVHWQGRLCFRLDDIKIVTQPLLLHNNSDHFRTRPKIISGLEATITRTAPEQ